MKAADTKSQSTLAGWNTGKEVTYKGSEATYHAYLSEDGKNAWIYLVETTNKTKSLKFPDAVEGAVVTRVGYDTALRKLEDADEFNQNISGVTVEYAHGVDGWSEKTINVESVVLPKNLTILESTALSGLRKVKSITIPDGVQKISAETFYGCKSLKEVKLPKSLAFFDNYTSFSACPKLSKVTLSKENKSFKMQKGLLLNKKGTKLIWAVPAKNKITVPDSVTSIADNALKAGKATSVYLGKKVKIIGKDAIAGKKITGMKDKELSEFRRRNIGYIYQDYRLIPEYTAYENIVLPLILDNKDIDGDEVRELMSSLQIEYCYEKYPYEMSGGEQQRVAIARALINHPAVVYADEPTGNLDAGSSENVAAMLALAASKYRQTIIMVTHDKQMAGYADRVLSIVDGNVSSEVNV